MMMMMMMMMTKVHVNEDGDVYRCKNENCKDEYSEIDLKAECHLRKKSTNKRRGRGCRVWNGNKHLNEMSFPIL